MREKYKETFDGVHASQRLKTEVLNVKREENGTKKRRIPAALVAAILVIALAGTAVAMELISRVQIQMVDPSEADELGVDEFDVGYIAHTELAPLPLEALSEKARERAAGVTEYADWAFDSWSEAAEFLGLDLAENSALAKLQKSVVTIPLPDGTDDWSAYCRAAVAIDPEMPGIPCSIFLRAAYAHGKCSITESVRIWIAPPGQSEPHDSVNTIDAGLLITGLDTLRLQTETYVTPSGMEVPIVTHEVDDFIDYTAYFVKDGFYYTVTTSGSGNAMDILKEVLDAYE